MEISTIVEKKVGPEHNGGAGSRGSSQPALTLTLVTVLH